MAEPVLARALQLLPPGSGDAGVVLLLRLLALPGADGDGRSLRERWRAVGPGELSPDLDLSDAELAAASAALLADGSPEPATAYEELLQARRGGGRKASGSFYTPPFAVAHVLEHALEPVLDEHVARLERLVATGDDDGAAAALLDLRVADLAMGAGVFLVAAAERIESRLTAFLARHSLPGVASADLPRGIVTRCLHGLDTDPVAVELARLALGPEASVRRGDGLAGRGAEEGFDCVLGNPPWEEATVEELGFWAQHDPGLEGQPTVERRRRVTVLQRTRPELVAELARRRDEVRETRRALLAGGAFPGMGEGDPDLYKAFCWRFWQAVRPGGRIGVVLPRSALAAAGSAPWRRAVLADGELEDVTLLRNARQWVFGDVHPQYTVALVTIRRGATSAPRVRLRGPYASRAAYELGRDGPPAVVPAAELAGWTAGAALPLLSSAASLRAFRRLRAHPRLDDTAGWGVRPVRELDATNDRAVFSTGTPETGGWPVLTGASFGLWEPDTGRYAAWADPALVTGVLQTRRVRAQRSSRSAFSRLPAGWAADPATLPCRRARIAFRDVTRASDSRTVIAALVPPAAVLTNKAPYLLLAAGDERDEAYLLGVLCSIPLDWYARRWVEVGLAFHLVDALPVPRPARDDPRRLRVEALAGGLAAADARYTAWAAAVGVPVGGVDEAERADVLAELDALVATLYALDENDVRHVYETFHPTWDATARLAAVLVHHRVWSRRGTPGNLPGPACASPAAASPATTSRW